VEHGVRGSDKELYYLHGCQVSLEGVWNVDREGSQSVVGVL